MPRAFDKAGQVYDLLTGAMMRGSGVRPGPENWAQPSPLVDVQYVQYTDTRHISGFLPTPRRARRSTNDPDLIARNPTCPDPVAPPGLAIVPFSFCFWHDASEQVIRVEVIFILALLADWTGYLAVQAAAFRCLLARIIGSAVPGPDWATLPCSLLHIGDHSSAGLPHPANSPDVRVIGRVFRAPPYPGVKAKSSSKSRNPTKTQTSFLPRRARFFLCDGAGRTGALSGADTGARFFLCGGSGRTANGGSSSGLGDCPAAMGRRFHGSGDCPVVSSNFGLP